MDSMERLFGTAGRRHRTVPPLKSFATTGVRTVLVLVGGALLVALGARLEVPMAPVPMSMQTYAVLVAGALAGARLGGAVIIFYLSAAALGAPLFAGGAAGVDHLLGPTAGYLAGFLVAAVVVGRLAERGWIAGGFLTSTLVMMIGHGLILGLGTGWLAWNIGWQPAIEKGLLPFLLGAVVKSLLAAATVFRWTAFRQRDFRQRDFRQRDP